MIFGFYLISTVLTLQSVCTIVGGNVVFSCKKLLCGMYRYRKF